MTADALAGIVTMILLVAAMTVVGALDYLRWQAADRRYRSHIARAMRRDLHDPEALTHLADLIDPEKNP